MKKNVATLLSIAFVLYFAWSSYQRQTPETEFDLDSFGRTPVVMNGRVQPLDSVARLALTAFGGKPVATYADGSRHKAIEWFAELALGQTTAAQNEAKQGAAHRPVFRIYDEGIRSFLPARVTKEPESAIKAMFTGVGSSQFYYSFFELVPFYERISKDAVEASKIDGKLRSRYQTAVIDLANNMVRFNALSQSLHHSETNSFVEELEGLESVMPEATQAMQLQQRGEPFDQDAFNALMSISSVYQAFGANAPYFTHPYIKQSDGALDWKKPDSALQEILQTGRASNITRHYAQLVDAYRASQPAAFNQAVADLHASLAKVSEAPFSISDAEQTFNYLAPFSVAKAGYILVLLLAALSWAPSLEKLGLRRAAFWTTAVVLVLHTIGILFRMHIIGYAPVINLYSSAIFVGWVAVVLALILEAISRLGIGSFVAAIIGFATLMIAPHLGGKADSLEMMRAVLDSNFWLSTHVLTITMGYGATFVAGFLAIVYILFGLTTPLIGKEAQKALRGMVYGIVCFSTFFSFVGTVLGGIWADDSWGRFWGWDPKENGAVLLVLWNVMILHCRWGGFIKTRGLMAMAVFGNIVTAWSWMGTNMLGIGLHSYGFMSEAFWALLAFVAANLLVIALAYIPVSAWRSPVKV